MQNALQFIGSAIFTKIA